jgi:hypothetical protein
MENTTKLILECKTLLDEQTEPFQRKMKAKHSRLKKRVIGHGGQANTAPFTEKPSMKRSKSAPPMGEDSIREVVREELKKYLIEENLWNKMKKVGLSMILGATLAGGATVIANVKNADSNKQEIAMQQQKEISSIYNKYYDNLIKQPNFSSKEELLAWQKDIKFNMRSNLNLNDRIIDAIMKDIGTASKEGEPIQTQKAIARTANIAAHAAKYEIQHKDNPNFKELDAIVHAMKKIESQGIVNETARQKKIQHFKHAR